MCVFSHLQLTNDILRKQFLRWKPEVSALRRYDYKINFIVVNGVDSHAKDATGRLNEWHCCHNEMSTCMQVCILH